MISNKYGYFSDDFKEFIITNPETPRPWFNYMWNENYVGLISHTGGGFSYLDSPRDNRLTRMRYNCLPWDRPGRYVIIKDTENGKYWSLSWAPTTNIKYDKYECHHGLGYTKIITKYDGIEAELTYFVGDKVNAEYWRVKLKNTQKKNRKLEIYSFVELLMGNALNDLINQPNDKHFTEIIFDKKTSTLTATRRYWVLNKKVSVSQPNLEWKYIIYFSSTLPISGFDGSLDNFIGKWRSEANPVSIEESKMKNTEITAGDPIAALQSKVILKPNSELNFAVTFAVYEKGTKNNQIKKNWEKIKSLNFIDSKFAELRRNWDKKLSNIKVETPESKFNLFINVWNQYQAAVTFDMARNSGYYHGGLLFGTGMRDQFQDILGVVITNPERVRKRILNALRFQFHDGSTLHNFFKLTDWGEKTNHSDTPLWIPFGIIEYLNETGDLSILDETVNFYDEGKANVYEHMKLAIDYCILQTSPRGIPKIMNGDWNDTLDKVGPEGKGETVWGGFFLAYNIKKTFELLQIKNDKDTLERWQNEYDKLNEVLNNIAWDGNWYIRAFKDNGEPLGTKSSKQGKIFINAQSWPIISGCTTKERADACIQSIKKYLLKNKGVQICFPSYTKVEENVGLISRCVPGKKENGAIFNHASSWVVLAAILNGNIDLAYDIYMRMNPMNSSADIDRYEVEPYVYAEYVTSPDHPTEGQASHSWLTGSAVWMLRIGLDYIIGFKTSIGGITLSPNIPKSWKEFKAERNFRGKKIKLHVLNPNGKNNSIKQIRINKENSASNFIEVDKIKSKIIEVEIILG